MKRLSYLFFRSILLFLLKVTPTSLLRVLILKCAGAKVGKKCHVSKGLVVDFPWRLHIGNNVYLNKGVYLDCRGGVIVIGSNTDISESALVFTLSHNIWSKDFAVKKGDVTIGSRCWVCTRSIILPGTMLGEGAVLGANSVYSGKSEKNILLQGVPAVVTRALHEDRASSVRNSVL